MNAIAISPISLPRGSGNPDGRGTKKYADGSTYDGGWKGGKWHCRGEMNGANGAAYTGAWSKRVAAADSGPFPKRCCTVDTNQAKEMQEDLPSTVTPTNEDGKASETPSPSMLALQDYESSDDECFAEDEDQTARDDQSQHSSTSSIDFMELCHRLTDKVEEQKRKIKSLKAQVKSLKGELEAEEAVPWGARTRLE